MKISVRLIVSLLIVVALVTFGFSLNQVNREKGILVVDLERRAVMLAESFQESLLPLIKSESKLKLNRLVNRFGNRERLKGTVIYDKRGAIITATNGLTQEAKQFSSQAVLAMHDNKPIGFFSTVNGQNTYVFTVPIREENSEAVGTLVMLYDSSFIDQQLRGIWEQNLMRFMVLSVLSVISTVLVVRWSITGPIARLSHWMREIRTAKPDTTTYRVPLREDALSSLISEATQMAKSLTIARKHAEEEARLRIQSESLWTPERLKEFMRNELKNKKLFVVSNREPYSHIKEGHSVRCVVPPGGLVTALDPVMRICDGVWIAHGNTDADRDTVDAHDKVRVPVEEPAYTLKRIWLTREQENGYYYGFSNEGLWPLCHITHTRPEFRQSDWESYQQVNELFSETLLREIDSEEMPLILVQDYHLSLLPSLIKKKRPDSKVALFWHIPWSSPESFGICPWRNEILMGMLGADLIGFHVQSFCNNFLDTVDKFLESQIDWEEFCVRKGDHSALIKPFPISVALEDSTSDDSIQERERIREIILKENDIETEYIGVGVDRIDYTKGIPERFHAIERFFGKYPQFVERFTFFELAAPSRDHLKKYRQLITEMEEIVDSINWRFKTKKWKPIVYLKANHSHKDIRKYYKAADLCMVTSLHDGMNLVAKEFVAARPDFDAALILSQFTGASRELRDAIMINPYDVEEMAEAIKSAVTISPFERRERMSRMYEFVKEHNIYSWAGKLIGELTRMR